jgi:hypothetical protein
LIKKEKKKPYVNNAKLYGVMCSYATTRNAAELAGKELPPIPNYVGECFMLICNKLATKGNFASYSYRDEMVCDAIENCVAAVDSFDPDKSKNPFAYFTQIAWYAFLRRIAKEKKQNAIKHKNFLNNDLLNELMYDNHHVKMSDNSYSDEIIRSYEGKIEKSKKVKKKGLNKLLGE